MRFTTLAALTVALLLSTAGASFAGASVGVAAAVEQTARGTAPSSATRTLTLGDQVIHNEVIETDGKGLLQILLADGTSFTVGPNSKMTIDSFVYDPDAGTAKVTASLSKGLFRFIGGKTSKSPDGAVLNTPVGTVGIRGGIADIDLGGHSTGTHIDMRYGDSVTLTENGQRVGFVFQNGYSIVIGPDGSVSVAKTPPAWTTAAQAFLSSKTGQHGGAHTPPTNATLVAHLNDKFSGPNGVIPGAPGTSPYTNPDTSTRFATWEEINNSDLATAYANYQGTATGTKTYVAGDPENLTGTFDLNYNFGEHDGHIDFALGENEFGTDVSADHNSGLATFSATDCNCSTTVNGQFIDQHGVTANGVGGIFNFVGEGSQITGAFGGTYHGPRETP